MRLHRGRERARTGCTLLEGPNLIRQATTGDVELHRVFVLDGEGTPPVGAVEVITVDVRVMRRLAGTETPRGPVAVVSIPNNTRPQGVSALVAWGVSDPGNLGTLIRSGAAFGLPVVVGPGTVDPWSPKVLRAGAGGHFHTPVTSVDDLDELADLTLVATVVTGGSTPDRLEGRPWAVLVGPEAHGLPSEITTRAEKLTIPMTGPMESLNAGVAGSIIAYEISRQRSAGGSPDGA